MNVDFSQDYFSLFQFPRQFGLDTVLLEEKWRKAAAEVHPDKFASHTEAEKRMALMMSTHVNEAYQTLKSPLNRARYLLGLHGIDTQEETNTSMPMDFLMEQMEWREAIEEATSSSQVEQLEQLHQRLQQEEIGLQSQLGVALDKENDLDAGALLVRKLRFFEKLGQEIENAIDTLLY